MAQTIMFLEYLANTRGWKDSQINYTTLVYKKNRKGLKKGKRLIELEILSKEELSDFGLVVLKDMMRKIK